MPKAKKSTSRKPAVKVKDLRAKKNPTGGKKKKAQEQYLIVKMEDVLITS